MAKKFKLNSNKVADISMNCKYNVDEFNYDIEFLNKLFSLVLHLNLKQSYKTAYQLPTYMDINQSFITEKQIKKIFLDLCEYLKLDSKYLKLITKEVNHINAIDCYGFFIPTGYIAGEITIYIHEYFTVRSIIGTLIHESTHAFCHIYQLEFGEFNEECTDIMMLLLGFGDVVIDCYKDIEIIDNSKYFSFRKFSIGYLGIHELLYLNSKAQENNLMPL